MKNKKPVIRFKGFSEEWEEKVLGSLAEIVRGASPRPIQDPKWFDENSNVGWLRISDVTAQDGRIQYLEQRISKAGEEKTRVLTEPHLLLSIAASVGKPVVNYVNTGVHDGFLIFKKPVFNQEFMFQWMKMFEEQWQKYGQPGSQVNLNSEIVKNQGILVPALYEQIQIGNFFKNLDTLITLHQRKYEKLGVLKKAMLEKMFPKNGANVPEIRFKGFEGAWEERKLGEIVQIKDSARVPKELWVESGIRYLRSSDLENNGQGGELFISIEAYENYKSKTGVPERGDVLFNSGGDIGFSILKTDDSPVYVQGGAILYARTSQSKEIDGGYLNVYFSTPQMKKYIDIASAGGTIKHFTLKPANAAPIVFPKKEEQQKIGTYFKNLDDLLRLHEKELEKLKNLKKALLEKMFV